MREKSLESMNILAGGRIVVPNPFEQGTVKRGEKETMMLAAERIVVNGRQLYAKGQKIKSQDIELYGIVDGRIPPPEDVQPRRKAKEKKADVVNSKSTAQEQGAVEKEGQATKQRRAPRGARRRRTGRA